MTDRHYMAIAAILSNPRITRQEIIIKLAEYFYKKNKKFTPEKFYAACNAPQRR